MASFRSLCVVAFLVIAAFFAAPSFGETATFHVDESQIRFRLSPPPVVEIPVVNTSGKALPGNFKLELLATDDSVESVVTGTFLGSPGTSVEKIAWPEDAKARGSLSQFGWHRLRYSFAPLAESGIQPCQGIVQLNRVLVGVIRVRIAAASTAKPGSRFPVRVRVDDPVTGRPRRSVLVELTVALDDDDNTTLKHALVTDFAGDAAYTFDLPKEVQAEGGKVSAKVSRGTFSDQAELDFDMRANDKLTLTSDKPLYQPGQVAHLRVLA